MSTRAEKFRERFFPQEPFHWWAYHQQLRMYLPAKGKVLDLGCGKNVALEQYRTSDREVWGADLQTHRDLRHKQWYLSLDADGKIPFDDDSFDVITTAWVLEHVQDPVAFLREVHRVLRPGGAFVAHTIHGSHYLTWMRRLLRVLPDAVTAALIQRLYGRPAEDTFPTFYRLNTANQLQAACRASRLSIVSIQRFADQGYFTFCGPMVRLAILADWFIEKLVPGNGRLYFTVTAQKPLARII